MGFSFRAGLNKSQNRCYQIIVIKNITIILKTLFNWPKATEALPKHEISEENSTWQSYFHAVPSTETQRQINKFTSQTDSEEVVAFDTALALSKNDFSGDMKDLDEKIKSLIGRGENIMRIHFLYFKSNITHATIT